MRALRLCHPPPARVESFPGLAVADLCLVRSMQRLRICLAVATFAAPLSASAAREYAIYAPRPAFPADARARHAAGSGVFALHVRPDGTVERVETLKSIGDPSLDQAAIAAFKRWRFRQHEKSWLVRIPIQYVYGLSPRKKT